MLVISRKKGESLQIGRDVTIHILDLKSGRVRIGIEAPQGLEIVRPDDDKQPNVKRTQKNS